MTRYQGESVPRTLVIGLDGANWSLIKPWLKAGELPNVREIREDGVYADSESCLPPVTFPNWKCYSTGKNPGKLGVYWFEGIDTEERELTRPDSGSFGSAEIWDYLNDAGYRAGILNMPTTYPPREIDGVMVCGGPDAKEGEAKKLDSGYTFPESLESRLKEEFDYRVHPNPLLSSNEERGEEVEAILDIIRLRFEVARHLLREEELDFLHVTVFYINVLQHFFWRDEVTLRGWKVVDEEIGRLLDEFEDLNLFLMSDHGCGETDTQFFVNRWLEEEGFLETKTTSDDLLMKLGLTRNNLLKVAKRLNLVDFLSENVPQSIQRMVPMEDGAIREQKLKKVVWEETDAVASGQGPVYLTPRGRDRKGEIIEKLKALKSPITGENIAKDVHDAKEYYHGDRLDEAPDIVIEQAYGVTTSDRIGDGPAFNEPEKWRAENVRQGIFAAYGPDVAQEGRIGDLSIVDIAPTVLTLMGVPVPRDADGSPFPISADEREPSYRDPIDVDSDEEAEAEDEVSERLRALGYMD